MPHTVSCGGVETMFAEIDNKLTHSLEDMNRYHNMILAHKCFTRCGQKKTMPVKMENKLTESLEDMNR
jgi:hypothetical protein